MKYAFVHKNFRQLSFERKTIFLAHALTLVFCFFPWFSADPVYESEFFYNAFEGAGFLIGTFIFLISLIITLLFVDRLLEKRKVKLPFPENWLYFGAGLQQLLLLVIMWSVLAAIGNDFENHEIRFGIFFVFIAQVCALVATFLDFQLEQQKKARSFFANPDNQNETKS